MPLTETRDSRRKQTGIHRERICGSLTNREGMLPEIQFRGKRRTKWFSALGAFGQGRLNIYPDVLVQLIGDVHAHVLRLRTVSPQDVSGLVMRFFGRAVFQSLMKVLV